MREELKKFEQKMQRSYETLLDEYQGIRAGRANPHVLDKIKVDYYGNLHLYSRLETFQFQRHVLSLFSLGKNLLSKR